MAKKKKKEIEHLATFVATCLLQMRRERAAQPSAVDSGPLHSGMAPAWPLVVFAFVVSGLEGWTHCGLFR